MKLFKRCFEKLKAWKKRREDIKVYKRKRKEFLISYVKARKANNIDAMDYFANLVACEDALLEDMLEA